MIHHFRSKIMFVMFSLHFLKTDDLKIKQSIAACRNNKKSNVHQHLVLITLLTIVLCVDANEDLDRDNLHTTTDYLQLIFVREYYN